MGLDLVSLEKKYPQLFNSLEKSSSCYIELDLHVTSILDSYSQ